MPGLKYEDKNNALQIVRELPDDSTLDDIIRELLVARMVAEAEEDFAAGRVLTHEQMVKEVESWFTSSGRKRRSNGSVRSTITSRKTTPRRRSA